MEDGPRWKFTLNGYKNELLKKVKS